MKDQNEYLMVAQEVALVNWLGIVNLTKYLRKLHATIWLVIYFIYLPIV